jgi:RNA polymerase sigma-70 factor, ECF subfamily
MDAQHFEELYKSHYRQLRSTARQLTGDADAAHDLVQEVFLRLWNRHDQIDNIMNPGAYLYKSVVNASLNHLARNKGNRQAESLQLPSDASSEAGLDLKELQRHIQRALDQLPPKCRAIFILSRFEDKKNKEIAALLGLSLKTVENQMGIALKKMREHLRPYISKDVFVLGFAFGFLSNLLMIS